MCRSTISIDEVDPRLIQGIDRQYRSTIDAFSTHDPDAFSTHDPVRLVGVDVTRSVSEIICIIIHQTHYEKSDWSRAFNQFTIACEHDMIKAISAADIAFIMSSSKSAWLLSPLKCSPQKQHG